MKIKKIIYILITGIVLLSLPVTALAQEAGLTLKLTRDFGYGGFNGDIQGTFSMSVSGPETLEKVEFYIDDLMIGTVMQAPFKIQFHTDMYSADTHTLSAVGYLQSGETLKSNTYQRLFVSGDNAMQSVKSTILPLLGLVLVVTVLGIGSSVLGTKNKKFEAGVYGPAGGTVCKLCGMPFSRNLLSPNMVAGKLEKCPHCGKYQLAIRATSKALWEAEARWQDDKHLGEFKSEDSETERLRREIEESRFEE